jgi:arsenate reductase
MVTDRRLREAQRLGEVAHTGLTSRLGLNETQEPKPRRVCERLQRARQSFRLVRVERLTLQQRRTRGRDGGDALHAQILTHIDVLEILTQVDMGNPETMQAVDPVDQQHADQTAAPQVLFVCVHNAGRSQMAAGLVKLRSAGRIQVRSAGTAPAKELNPVVVEAMTEIGVDMSEEFPKPLTDEGVRAADVVITMGCGDACPIYPGKRYEDWELDDPAGKDLEAVRRIRNDVDERVQRLVAELIEV